MIGELVALLGKTNVSDIFPILARFDLQGIERKAKEVMSWADTILDSVIEERLKMEAVQEKKRSKDDDDVGSKDYLGILLELNKQQGDDKAALSMKQLKALLLDIVSAGTDTTTTTLEWAFAEMMQKPYTMRKAQEKLGQVVGMSNKVEESHISKLPYLNAVVKETLRDPDAWEGPLEFLPERFLREKNEYDCKGNNFNYLPFGSGRRICPGIPLAERMATYMLASLLHSFEWRLPENVELDLSEESGLVLKKKAPLVIIPTPRLSNVELYN
ncbi:3,9-dihydroxypterocarpan 6A-monooxygenase-like [Macadamia integrifolia]|uniref:3,9-dihydroxypterocarpan 6A-monooxygenase-like n=1 Tax=Macadamia integrifolia TaxID=60698 RepID=UPI001C4FFD86|nr:3,9-dihydroxypterocarpan 6A-monooxygenase-like [Macadamia integrifolia]